MATRGDKYKKIKGFCLVFHRYTYGHAIAGEDGVGEVIFPDNF
jgi:hypothetical protein